MKRILVHRSSMCRAITKNAMEIAGGGRDRKWVKVWKEKETLTNIELIACILKFYVTSIYIF